MGICLSFRNIIKKSFVFELLMEGGYQKSSGLCPNTLRRLLWLDDEHAIQFPRVYPLTKVRLLLPNELVENAHGLMPIFRLTMMEYAIGKHPIHQAQDRVLLMPLQPGEICDDTDDVTIEGLDQRF